MSDLNAEELVDVYLSIRNERKLLLSQYEEADGLLKTDMEQLEAALLNVCNTINANSLNTKHGTVIRSVKERYVCSDWDNFKEFIRENDAVDCLERRIHQGNFKSLLEEREGEGLPPGVNCMREFAITVRKSSKE
jgi:hypothetical protein